MGGSYAVTNGIEVTVRAAYVEAQSEPESGRFFFAYEVTIENVGERTAKLLSRHWIIADGDGEEKVVRGAGVVGEQPVLDPGEMFQYTSFCPLSSPVGSMRGSYHFALDGGETVDAEVAPFTLAVPSILN